MIEKENDFEVVEYKSDGKQEDVDKYLTIGRVSGGKMSNFGKGKTILSVEDNPANRIILQNFLTSNGFKVINAPDGEQGLEMIINNKPDIIIADIQLPKMDGLELTRTIRKNTDPKINKLPIIFATAYALIGDAEKGMEAGGDAYITKPYNFNELLDTLKKYI